MGTRGVVCAGLIELCAVYSVLCDVCNVQFAVYTLVCSVFYFVSTAYIVRMTYHTTGALHKCKRLECKKNMTLSFAQGDCLISHSGKNLQETIPSVTTYCVYFFSSY